MYSLRSTKLYKGAAFRRHAWGKLAQQGFSFPSASARAHILLRVERICKICVLALKIHAVLHTGSALHASQMRWLFVGAALVLRKARRILWCS